jgi:hypothetical protein
MDENGFGQPLELSMLDEGEGRCRFMGWVWEEGCEVGLDRTESRRGTEKGNVQHSLPKLDILGVNESDQNSFLEEVDSVPCKKMMCGCMGGGGQD